MAGLVFDPNIFWLQGWVGVLVTKLWATGITTATTTTITTTFTGC